MKLKITILFLFTITNVGNIFSQYLPMVQENKFWIYQRFYNSETGQVGSGFLVNFEGDTILNSTNYKKVWQQELSGTHPCPMGFLPCFEFDQPYTIISRSLIGFIREDTIERRVYYKPDEGLYCNVEEYMLFDFSLVVNDELDDCKKEALGGEPDFGIIDSITYLQIWGDLRKVFHTTGFVSYIHDPFSWQVNIIEGVGFDRYGLFHEPTNLFTEMYDYCEGSLSDCNIISQSIDLTKKEGISFYPNPTRAMIFINNILPLASVTAISISGQETNVSCHGNIIELNGIASGFYVLKIKTTKGKIYMAKIIKE